MRNTTNTADLEIFPPQSLRRPARRAREEPPGATPAAGTDPRKTPLARRTRTPGLRRIETGKASLEDYLNRFNNGAHATEARNLIAQLDRREADEPPPRRSAAERRRLRPGGTESRSRPGRHFAGAAELRRRFHQPGHGRTQGYLAKRSRSDGATYEGLENYQHLEAARRAGVFRATPRR